MPMAVRAHDLATLDLVEDMSPLPTPEHKVADIASLVGEGGHGRHGV